MAGPPFSISTTLPAATDLISTWPTQEPPYRQTVSDWLNFISDATTGLLKPSAFPALVNSWVIQSVNATTNAILTYKNSSGVVRAVEQWDYAADKWSVIAYAVDGTTPKSKIDVIGGAGTANVNIALGTLTVGGTAVVLTNSAVATAIIGTGALAAGSIAAGFGNINIGANTLTAGAATLASMASSGAVSGTTGTFSGAVSGTTITGSGAVQGTNLITTANIVAVSSANTLLLRPNGAASSTGQMQIATNGNVTAAGDLTASSDRRLKKSIAPMNHLWAWDMVREIEPKSYIRKFNDTRAIGFIADDVEPYAPELVGRDAKGYRTLAYPNMVAILWAVVQDLQREVTALKEAK